MSTLTFFDIKDMPGQTNSILYKACETLINVKSGVIFIYLSLFKVQVLITLF